MANFNLKLTGDMPEFTRFLDIKRFKTNLDRELKKATIRNCLMLIKLVKQSIKNKEYVGDSSLTLALSKSNLALVDESHLWKAINYQLYSSISAEVGIVGVTRLSTGSKGKNKTLLEMEKLVELMETGYTIQVTDKMRMAIAIALREKNKNKRKAKKSKLVGNDVKTNKVSTYRVPARPFLTNVWNKPDVQKMLRINWKEALERAFKAQGAKGGEEKEK